MGLPFQLSHAMQQANPPGVPFGVHVLGATGRVGQRFVALLEHHPWFRLAGVSASERSCGQTYGDAVDWQQATPIPVQAREFVLGDLQSEPEAKLVFSALDTESARKHERRLAAHGHVVVTNAAAHRLDHDVPLIIPEVNPEHLGLLAFQDFPDGGALLANPNCTTIGLALVARPLRDAFGLEKLVVVSQQAVSGAGRSGPSLQEMTGNVVPYIAGEEEKLSRELPRLLGQLEDDRILPAHLPLSATCTRVAVEDGHTLSIFAALTRSPAPSEAASILRAFRSLPQDLGLPSAPKHPVLVLEDESAPQPRLHRDLEGGMSSVVGRLRSCPIFDLRLVLLSHNTLRGAAGGALLVAELALAQGAIRGA